LKAILPVLFFSLAAFGQVSTCLPQEVCIDDFRPGSFPVTFVWDHHPLTASQLLTNGILRGTWRNTRFDPDSSNPLQQPNIVDIQDGHFVLNNGFQTLVVGYLTYDCNQDCTQSPLHIDLGGYDRFRFHFPSGGGNLTVTVFRGDQSRSHARWSTAVSPRTVPFFVDAKFFEFVDPGHFEDVIKIVVELEPTVGSSGMTAITLCGSATAGCPSQ
jgi:hypothetical protein